MSKYALRPQDILISVVGTLGNACIAQEKDLPAIFSCKSTVIRTKKINPIYLLTYLNCKYGQALLLRKERGAIQKGLNLDDLKTIFVPIFLKSFQERIEEQFLVAQKKLEESKAAYTAAEDLLLESLGLKDFQPTQQNVNVKSFKDSFLSSGRLDAEYYQPKYEEIEAKIRNSNFGFCKVKDCFSQNKSTYAKDKEGFNYTERAVEIAIEQDESVALEHLYNKEILQQA